MFNDLELRLHRNGRPKWIPRAGLDPQALDDLFTKDLEAAEIERKISLQIELSRQLGLIKKARRFEQEVDKLKHWGQTCRQYLSTKEVITTVDAAELALETLASHQLDHRVLAALCVFLTCADHE